MGQGRHTLRSVSDPVYPLVHIRGCRSLNVDTFKYVVRLVCGVTYYVGHLFTCKEVFKRSRSEVNLFLSDVLHTWRLATYY